MSKRMAALLMAGWCMACGGEDDDPETTTMQEEARPTQDGPAGCYVIMQMKCDCDLEEAECTDPAAMVWVPAGPRGCASCAM